MDINAIQNLKDYFITKAANIQREFLVSNPTGHPTDTGENRQDLLIDFLNEHLPARYEALTGGKVFDSEGNISEQVDVIVYDKNTPRLKDKSRTLFLVEGVSCAIEVKPNLNPTSLKEGLDKVDSFKKPTKSIIAPLSTGDVKTKVYSGVFAFTSKTDPKVVLQTIVERYKDKELELCIDFLCVNNSYMIVKNVGDWLYTVPDGTQTPITERFVFWAFNEMSLYKLLMLISKESAPNYLGSPDYSKYINI